jgi:thiol-disulfide isomerase/thioredoxin
MSIRSNGPRRMSARQFLFGMALLLACGPSARGADPADGQQTDEIPAPAYVTLMLARDPAVQSELKLSAAQLSAVRAAVAEIDQPFWHLRDVPPKQCADKLAAGLATLRAALAAALTPHQLTRFDQLVMQARGARALIAADVREQLMLSVEQTEQIGELVAAAKEGQLDSQKVLALLSAEQKSKLGALFGPRFDLSRVQRVGCIAPELRSVEAWINGNPQSLEDLRGRVVVVHFWAFGCINCVRNLPHYQGWYEKFPQSDLTIVGIHTPETSAERDLANLKANVAERGIKYPVAFDAASENWKAWANNMWPSVYLIDRRGQVRAWWYGELNWQGARGEESMRKQIEALIAEK